MYVITDQWVFPDSLPAELYLLMLNDEFPKLLVIEVG
jgi:hypothetical protein